MIERERTTEWSTKPIRDLTTDELGRKLQNPRTVLHSYDFLCPFCYVGRHRTVILVRHGLEVMGLPFQAHPTFPPTGFR